MTSHGKRLAAVLLAAAAVLHVLTALRVPVGAMVDDAVYLLLARALSHGSYALPDGFHQPVTSFWPGMPLLWSLPVWLCQPRWGLCRLPALLWSWAALGLTWKLARVYLSEARSAACVLFVAFNPVFISQAGVSASDVCFLTLSLAAFWALGARRGLLMGAAALACLTRPEGILLALSLSVAVFWREGAKRALGFCAVVLAPAAAWLLRNHFLTGSASDYLAQMVSQMSMLWNPGAQLFHAAQLCAVLLGKDLIGLSASQPILAALGLLVLVSAGAGVAIVLRRGPDTRVLAMALYGVSLGCLHLIWWQILDRYLLAVLPLVWLFVLQARRGARWAGAVVLGLLLWSGARDFLPARRPAAELWPETMAWLRANTAPDTVLQGSYAPALMLWTGRPALTPFRDVRLREHWLAKCLNNHIEYLVLEDDLARWSRMPAPWLDTLRTLRFWAESSPFVSQAFSSRIDGARVYRIRHPNPKRFLRAWALFHEAATATDGAISKAKLREAVGLEPELASAWSAAFSSRRPGGRGP